MKIFLSKINFEKSIVILFLLNSFCCYSWKDEYLGNQKLEGENIGYLSIELLGNSELEIRNLNLKVSSVIDIAGKQTMFIPTPFTIMIPVQENGPPILKKTILLDSKFSLKNNNKIQFYLPESEYYASLDSLANSEFSFSPEENKVLLFTFGYRLNPKSGTISSYDELNCFNEFKRFAWAAQNNYTESTNYCKKILIQRGKETKIRITFSESQPTNLSERIIKIIPGIFVLSPFTNKPGYFTKRFYSIELINPTD